MRLTVLVTRSEPGAAATAARVRALGHAPIVMPLTRTVALPEVAAVPEDLPETAVVAVTSAAALRHAPAGLVDRLRRHRCLAVGEATAEAARAAGFADVRSGPGDAEGLAGLIVSWNRGEPVVFLAGRVRRDILEPRLRAAGIPVMPVETYDTVEMSQVTDFEDFLSQSAGIDVVLVQAGLGIAPLMRITSHPLYRHLFDGTRFLCMAQRLAAVIPLRDRQTVAVAARPDEASLLALLDRA